MFISKKSALCTYENQWVNVSIMHTAALFREWIIISVQCSLKVKM